MIMAENVKNTLECFICGYRIMTDKLALFYMVSRVWIENYWKMLRRPKVLN